MGQVSMGILSQHVGASQEQSGQPQCLFRCGQECLQVLPQLPAKDGIQKALWYCKSDHVMCHYLSLIPYHLLLSHGYFFLHSFATTCLRQRSISPSSTHSSWINKRSLQVLSMWGLSNWRAPLLSTCGKKPFVPLRRSISCSIWVARHQKPVSGRNCLYQGLGLRS